MYLLDTNVVSDTRRFGTKRQNNGLAEWMNAQLAASFYLSSITVFELELGIQRMEHRDPDQGKVLRTWFRENVMRTFEGRILSFNWEAGQVAAGMHVPDPKSYQDSFIAAIALRNQLTLVTRNEKDFETFGVSVLNPYA